jgi:uncharacterized protein YyaL (SSP411 family)
VIEEEKSAGELLKEIFNSYLPNKIVLLQPKGTNLQLLASELLSGKKAIDGRPTAYVCQDFTCSPPVTSPAELKKLLHD